MHLLRQHHRMEHKAPPDKSRRSREGQAQCLPFLRRRHRSHSWSQRMLALYVEKSIVAALFWRGCLVPCLLMLHWRYLALDIDADKCKCWHVLELRWYAIAWDCFFRLHNNLLCRLHYCRPHASSLGLCPDQSSVVVDCQSKGGRQSTRWVWSSFYTLSSYPIVETVPDLLFASQYQFFRCDFLLSR